MTAKFLTYPQLGAQTEQRIKRWMTDASGRTEPDEITRREQWAYGAYLLWESLTTGWQAEGDSARLEALTAPKQPR